MVDLLLTITIKGYKFARGFMLKKSKGYRQIPDLDDALIQFIRGMWSLWDCRNLALMVDPSLEIARTVWDSKKYGEWELQNSI